MHRLTLVVTLALSTLGLTAFAQQQPAPDAPNGHGHHRMHNPHKQAEMIGRRLNLSPDQTAKLEPILAARQEKVQALRSDASLTPDARRAQFKAIHEQTKQQLAGVLTPEQLNQMKEMRHHHGHHGQDAPAEAPPAA